MTRAPEFGGDPAIYRAWLASDAYRDQFKALVASNPSPPRSDWPIDTAALIDRHHAHVTMCLEAAARHARAAQALQVSP